MADLWTCSPGLCDLYGIPRGQPPTTATMLERVVDEDRAVVLEGFQHLLATHAPSRSSTDWWIPKVAHDDWCSWVRAKAAGGEMKRLSGFAVDITETIREEASDAVLASTQHRAAIEQAKGALMLSFGVQEEVAFDLLRAYSSQHNIKLIRVAEHIVTGMAEPAFSREEPVRCLLDLLLDLDRTTENGQHGRRGRGQQTAASPATLERLSSVLVGAAGTRLLFRGRARPPRVALVGGVLQAEADKGAMALPAGRAMPWDSSTAYWAASRKSRTIRGGGASPPFRAEHVVAERPPKGKPSEHRPLPLPPPDRAT